MLLYTLDFLIYAQKDEELKKSILEALESEIDTEVCTKIHRLTFVAEEQYVHIEPLSKAFTFAYKILPSKIAYSAVKKVIKSNKLEFETNDFIIKNEEGDLQ